jgi:hypothetical protein
LGEGIKKAFDIICNCICEYEDLSNPDVYYITELERNNRKKQCEDVICTSLKVLSAAIGKVYCWTQRDEETGMLKPGYKQQFSGICQRIDKATYEDIAGYLITENQDGLTEKEYFPYIGTAKRKEH